jgi:hypothetical protein
MARNFDRSLILYEREFLYEPAVYNLKSNDGRTKHEV